MPKNLKRNHFRIRCIVFKERRWKFVVLKPRILFDSSIPFSLRIADNYDFKILFDKDGNEN